MVVGSDHADVWQVEDEWWGAGVKADEGSDGPGFTYKSITWAGAA